MLGTSLDPEYQDSIKATYACSYCRTVVISVIVHPTHLAGEGECETQRDDVKRKALRTKGLKALY